MDFYIFQKLEFPGTLNFENTYLIREDGRGGDGGECYSSLQRRWTALDPLLRDLSVVVFLPLLCSCCF